MDGDTLWLALALVLVIEGMFPFVSPAAWRRTFAQLLQLSDAQLRAIALASMAVGLLLTWLLSP